MSNLSSFVEPELLPAHSGTTKFVAGWDSVSAGRLVLLTVDGRTVATSLADRIAPTEGVPEYCAFLFTIDLEDFEPGSHRLNVARSTGERLLADDIVFEVERRAPPSRRLPQFSASASLPKKLALRFNADAAADLSAFAFDVYCDEAKIGRHTPLAGAKVDGSVHYFAVPRDLMTGDMRTISVVPVTDGFEPGFAEVEGVYFPDAGRRSMPLGLPAYIVDPSLANARGHMFNLAKRLSVAFSEQGLSPVVVGNSSFPPDKFDAQFMPHFSRTPYEASDETRLYGGERNTKLDFKVDLARAISQELANLDLLLPDECVLVFPTITATMMLGICMWLETRRRKIGQTIILPFMLESSAIRVTGSRYVELPNALLFRAGFDLLSVRKVGGVRFWCSSPQELGGYKILASDNPAVNVTLGPNFVAPLPSAMASAGAPEIPTVLLYAGEAKRDKGFDNLADVLELIGNDESLRSTTFRLHFVESTSSETSRVRSQVQRLIAAGYSIDLTEGFLEMDAYEELICGASLYVLGYNPEHYFERSSGVMWEALAYGRPVVVYANSFMSREAKLYGFPAFVAREPGAAGLFKAMKNALAGLRGALDKAAVVAREFNASNGVHVFATAVADEVRDRFAPQGLAETLGEFALAERSENAPVSIGAAEFAHQRFGSF